jgi:hypothetical protein
MDREYGGSTMKTASLGLTLLVGICLAVLVASCEEGEGDATPTATAIVSPTASPTPTVGGAALYEVTVRFNTAVTQDDIDEVGALLRAYDNDLQFVIMESFPPIGRALLETHAPDFCQTVQAELEAKTYIDDVSCRST